MASSYKSKTAVTTILEILRDAKPFQTADLPPVAVSSSEGDALRCAYLEIEMRKTDFAAELAQYQKLTTAEAADQLDEVTFRILKRLRQGRAALLPGLGRFQPGPPAKFKFQSPRKGKP